MGALAAGGAVFTGLSQATRLFLTILSTIIVSRILAPDDYGVIAMVAPVTAFILTIQDLGLSQATIQAQQVDHRSLSSLFWLNLAASTLLAALVVLSAPVVGWFYGDVRPAYVTAASGATVFIIGCTIQHTALLNRSMRFASIAIADIVSAIVSFIATLTAALLFKSYWALWLGSFLGTVVWASLIWFNEKWRPAAVFNFQLIKKMVSFGGDVTGMNLLTFLSRNLDNVLVAKAAGTAQLGLYDRAYKLMMLPLQNINSPLARVMLPVLGRLRSEPERYRRSFLGAARTVVLLTTPGIIVSAATSDRLIPFLLGERWASAAPIYFWLSLAGLVQPVSSIVGWLFISSGQTRTMLRCGVSSAVLTILGFVVGLHWGAVGVAASLLITTAMRLPYLFHYCTIDTSVSRTDLYGLLLEPAIGGAISWVIIGQISPLLPVAPLLCISLVLAYGITLLVYSLTKGGRELLTKLWGLGWDICVGAVRQLRSAGLAS